MHHDLHQTQYNAMETTMQSVSMRPKLAWKQSLLSFFLVLCLMPLGHAFMILMELIIAPEVLPYSAFALGFVGLVIAVCGIFVQKDTAQTICGLIGGLLLWTGWVEFLFMYYAQRFGAHPEIVDGVITTTTTYAKGIAANSSLYIDGSPVMHMHDIKDIVVTRPEYLLMPATFGFWIAVMLLYIFNVRTGCNFMLWCQKVFLGKKRNSVVRTGMTRHTAMVTFMETMMLLWSCYLLLMFCYDPRFLGQSHPVTIAVGVGCFIGFFFIFRKQLDRRQWGANIRMAIPAVIVLWTPVEILGRNNLFNEIWIAPLEHMGEMIAILITFILIGGYLAWQHKRTAKA